MADKKQDDSIVQVPKALWTYLIKQHGGLDAVYSQFYRAQLEAWVARGWSWGKILAKATEAGCGDWLAKQSPAGFQGTAKPIREVKAKAKKPAGKRKRLSADEANRLSTAIVADVTKFPGSKIGEISQRTGSDKSVLVRLLKSLLASRSIRSKGEKGQRVYGPVG